MSSLIKRFRNRNLEDHQLLNDRPLTDLPIARNISPERLQVINQRFSEISNMKKWIQNFNSKPYKGKFWDYNNYQLWPLSALNARRLTDNISDFQFATVCLQYALVKQFIKETQTYETTINPETRQIKYTGSEARERNISIAPKWIGIKDKNFKKVLFNLIQATDEESVPYYFFQNPEETMNVVDDIYNNLQNYPKSERYLFLIDGVDNIKNYSYILYHFKDHNIPFNGDITLNNKKFLAVPSFTILNLFLKTIRPRNIIGIDPIIGKATTSDISKARRQNLRLVSLPMEETPISKIVDRMWGGIAGSVIHDACYHAFKLVCTSPNENKALLHVLNNLLDPYILNLQESYNDALTNFFDEYQITNNAEQKKIKNALNFSNTSLDLILHRVNNSINEGNQSVNISDFIKLPNELLNDLIPLANLEKATEDLVALKNLMLKLRAAKRFRWRLDDGDLWENFSISRNKWIEIF